MIWIDISDQLPPEKQEVLLHWPVPDSSPTYRLGLMIFKPWEGQPPIWRFDLDCGDASACIFSDRDYEQPTHWAHLAAPPALTDPARDAADDLKSRLKEG